MNNQMKIPTDIEGKLNCLPDREPPADLKMRIMASLPQQRKSWIQQLSNKMYDFLQNLSQPLTATISMACLLVTFYGGMQFGKMGQGPVPIHAENLVVADNMNADSSFFLGRSLLAAGKPQEALTAFRRAEQLGPKNPKYTLWQAASYYAQGDAEEERRSYQQLIERQPNFYPAKLNLAHNLLQEGQFALAEQLYQQVLEYYPLEKSALYNRGLVLHLQKKKTAERDAWKKYLNHYRTGSMAFRALQHLHDLSDYSYRSYQLGYRTIILNQDYLLSDSISYRDEEIKYLSTQFARQPEAELNIIVFNQDDAKRAKRIASTLRGKITGQLPAKSPKKILISWFGESESIKTADKNLIQLPEGLLIFSTPGSTQKGERI